MNLLDKTSFFITDDILQCSICMEDFELHENVKKLPCEHHYHKVCIVTWLEMVSIMMASLGSMEKKS